MSEEQNYKAISCNEKIIIKFRSIWPIVACCFNFSSLRIPLFISLAFHQIKTAVGGEVFLKIFPANLRSLYESLGERCLDATSVIKYVPASDVFVMKISIVENGGVDVRLGMLVTSKCCEIEITSFALNGTSSGA
jgi:hypothetical protein